MNSHHPKVEEKVKKIYSSYIDKMINERSCDILDNGNLFHTSKSLISSFQTGFTLSKNYSYNVEAHAYIIDQLDKCGAIKSLAPLYNLN